MWIEVGNVEFERDEGTILVFRGTIERWFDPESDETLPTPDAGDVIFFTADHRPGRELAAGLASGAFTGAHIESWQLIGGAR